MVSEIRGEEVREKVGNRIREVRKRRGLTMEEVARQTDLHQNTQRRYERGNTDIPLPRLLLLARFYETPLAYFLQDLSEDQPLALRGIEGSPPEKSWISERLDGAEKRVVIDLHRLLDEEESVEVVIS